MDPSGTSFAALLEQYIFSVAGQLVDLLDRPEQDQLVQLLLRIDTSSGPVASAGGASADSLHSPLPEPFPAKPNEPRSVYRKGPHNEERRRLLEGSIAGYQTNIDVTLGYISRVDVLLERVEKTAMMNPRKVDLINRYQLLKTVYTAFLAKVRALQIKQEHKLNRYH